MMRKTTILALALLVAPVAAHAWPASGWWDYVSRVETNNTCSPWYPNDVARTTVGIFPNASPPIYRYSIGWQTADLVKFYSPDAWQLTSNTPSGCQAWPQVGGGWACMSTRIYVPQGNHNQTEYEQWFWADWQQTQLVCFQRWYGLITHR